jgi:hypothetical protein
MSDAHPGTGGQVYYTRFRGTILGPYSVEKLKALRARGQFSRIHEVSTDRKSWSPASSIDDLFALPASEVISRSGPQASVAAAAGSAASGATATPVQPATVSASSANTPDSGAGGSPTRSPGPADAALWYYRIDDQQFGPTATAELQKLIGEGRLGQTDIVWRDGLLDWLAVEEVPELIRGGLPPPVRKVSSRARAGNRGTLIRAIVAVLILVVTALVVYLAILGKLRLSLTNTSMLKEEFLRVEQRPADVFHRQAPVAVGGDVFFGGVELGRNGLAAQGRQVQHVDDLVVGPVRGHHLGDAAGVVAQFVVHDWPVDHLQGLRQV